ncbi:hypothetical protein N7456_007984 [Penicillium angulare]|uniref:Uncharacterized protein n=1 Tax=Penicillium angulare TaxID=116970 RepID=A0A9W9FBN8_9EURO|nr:hypothetical protein N7456_007984 [Penicillium angulare]
MKLPSLLLLASLASLGSARWTIKYYSSTDCSGDSQETYSPANTEDCTPLDPGASIRIYSTDESLSFQLFRDGDMQCASDDPDITYSSADGKCQSLDDLISYRIVQG